ncbi:extensin family protein [Pararhodobacter sp.]|uniref:extensin family protein n=1 Tax=Pararhodobacter sp. TaxID=2127056 RepID=UPI002FDE7DE3
MASWRNWAGGIGLALLATAAVAQAPERSQRPPPRPVAGAAPAIVEATRPGTVAGIRMDRSGALLRSPLPVARPEFDSVQLPESMIPTGLRRGEAAAGAVTGETIAALQREATPDLRAAPPEAEPAQPPEAQVEPPSAATTEPPSVAQPEAQPEAETTADAEPALEAVTLSPYAPALSPRPQRRSAAAYTRHAEAVRRRAAQPAPTTVAAGGSSSGGGVTGRPAAGLCGVSTLEGQPMARVTSAVQGCGIAEPVSVTAVAGIRLSQPATLECDTARAFDRWVRQVMLPAMGNAGGGVTQIRVAAHYTCRPRNNRAGARVSEHGRGRAIDVAGFRLANGQTVMVLSDWPRGPYRNALRQMHTNACGIFRTTLGPGSDGHHEDHFHYDMAMRGNNSTYCR